MIDFHSHILMGIDDGSRNLAMSASMLDEYMKQGVDCIICTPHFYGDRERIEDFIERRMKASRSLEEYIEEAGAGFPILFFGAEVYFFAGISRAEGLERLTLEGTDVLLLEMPGGDWNQSMIDEVERLCDRFTVILVHLERYMTGKNKKYIKEIIGMTCDMPLYVQINSRSIAERRDRRKLIKMFRDGHAHFLGSDSHNTTSRPPNLRKGMQALEEKLGERFVRELDQFVRRFLHEKGLEF